VPGSIGQAQDPGRIFPGKRMSGHLGRGESHHPESGSGARGCRAQLLLIRGAVPGAKGGDVVVLPAVKGSCLMDLKLINDKGQDAGAVSAADACSVVNTTRRWCISWLPPTWRMVAKVIVLS
jgi:hypothetical protein